MNEVGILNEEFKTFLFGNLIELSTIEGNLISAAKEREIKTILITSCSPKEGKTISAISMGFSLAAEANARTLLIDGNLSAPKIHEIFNIDKSHGLTDVLHHRGNIDEIIQRTEFNNLNVITSGSAIAKKLDFFETDLIKDTLETLKQNFDYVVVDGQSVSGASDVSMISRYFDGILFVVECERTRWEVLQQAKEKIQSVGGKILGVVLNKRKYYIPQKLYAKV